MTNPQPQLTPTIAATLTSARRRIVLGFVSAHNAVDAGGHPVGSCSSTAVAWSIPGAIDYAVRHDELLFDEAWDYLHKTMFENPTITSREMAKRLDSFNQRQAIVFLTEALGETPSPTARVGTSANLIHQLLA